MTIGLDEPSPPQTSLRDRVIKGGIWTLGAHGFDLALRLISNLIMTRLLFPEAFGVVAAASALIVGLHLISDFGVHTIIIQSPRGDQDDFLRSGWVFQIWRGLALWAILLAICALISVPAIQHIFPVGSVFSSPSFPLITAALGIGLVLSNMESTAYSLNFRRLNFKPIVLLDMAGRIFPLPIMIVWALIIPNVWALVGGSLAGSVIRLVISHVLLPGPRMALTWDKGHHSEIVRFGRWIAVSSFGSFISSQCDVIILGLLLPSSMLGTYFIAKMLKSSVIGLLERLNISLALPIFGEVIRKNPQNLRNRYYRFRLPIDLASGLLGGMLFVTGNIIVDILYDSRYSQAGLMLQILAIGVVLFPFDLIKGAFIASGDSHVAAITSMLQATSLILCMMIGFIAFDTSGAILGVSIHRVVPSVLLLFLSYKRNWLSIWHELRIVPLFLIGVLIGEVLTMVANSVGVSNVRHIWHF